MMAQWRDAQCVASNGGVAGQVGVCGGRVVVNVDAWDGRCCVCLYLLGIGTYGWCDPLLAVAVVESEDGGTA